jgi:hypothetical protein
MDTNLVGYPLNVKVSLNGVRPAFQSLQNLDDEILLRLKERRREKLLFVNGNFLL